MIMVDSDFDIDVRALLGAPPFHLSSRTAALYSRGGERAFRKRAHSKQD